MTTFTHKIKSLYVAYAPQFDLSAYGSCRDEALNNLADNIRLRMAGEGDWRGKAIPMASADRPFRCDVCYRRFSSASSLTKHSY